MIKIYLILCSLSLYQVSIIQNKIQLGKYHSIDKNSYIILERCNGDTLIGKHCFVFQDGNRIDCCLEENSIRLFYNKKSNSEFIGSFGSCYYEKKYVIKITCINDFRIKISFPNNDYEFFKKDFEMEMKIDSIKK